LRRVENLLPQGRAVLFFERPCVRAEKGLIDVRREFARRRLETEHVEIAVAEAAVGLVELGPYNLSDVQSYFSTINQTLSVPIYNVLLGVDGVCSGTPTTGGCDDGEEVIDMEQAI